MNTSASIKLLNVDLSHEALDLLAAMIRVNEYPGRVQSELEVFADAICAYLQRAKASSDSCAS